MDTLVIINLLICAFAMVLGWYVLIKDLKIFSKTTKSPTIDSWLTLVGTLGWSVALLMAIDAQSTNLSSTDEWNVVYGANIFARFLFLVYWVGTLLKVKEHCKLRLKRLLQKQLDKGVAFEQTASNHHR